MSFFCAVLRTPVWVCLVSIAQLLACNALETDAPNGATAAGAADGCGPINPKIGDIISFTDAAGQAQQFEFRPPTLLVGTQWSEQKYVNDWAERYRQWVEKLKDLIAQKVINPNVLVTHTRPTTPPNWCKPSGESQYNYNSPSGTNVTLDDPTLTTEDRDRRAHLFSRLDQMQAALYPDSRLGVTWFWLSRVRVAGEIYDASKSPTVSEGLTCEFLLEFLACPFTKPSQQFAIIKGTWSNTNLKRKIEHNYPPDFDGVDQDFRLIPLAPFRCEDGLSGRGPYRLHWMDP